MLGAGETGRGWEIRIGLQRPRQMLKFKLLGTTILPKVGSTKMQLRVSPKSTRAWEKRMLVVLFTVHYFSAIFGSPSV